MAQQKKPPARPVQIAIYPPDDLYRIIQKEAAKRNRKLGPTCLAILREYFMVAANWRGDHV